MLWPKSFSELISALGIFGAIVSFVFAVVQWKSNQEQQNQKLAEERSKITDQRRIEAQKPFLDLQIQLYGEAVRITTRLANHADVGKEKSNEWLKLQSRFEELYWGELALVENREVASAMVAFREGLTKSVAVEDLKQRSLRLAHAVRASLDESWGIRVWTSNR